MEFWNLLTFFVSSPFLVHNYYMISYPKDTNMEGFGIKVISSFILEQAFFFFWIFWKVTKILNGATR